jgi:hypothetical protein
MKGSRFSGPGPLSARGASSLRARIIDSPVWLTSMDRFARKCSANGLAKAITETERRRWFSKDDEGLLIWANLLENFRVFSAPVLGGCLGPAIWLSSGVCAVVSQQIRAPEGNRDQCATWRRSIEIELLLGDPITPAGPTACARLFEF